LTTYGAIGTVLAGYHYDLNALTIHGKSRYPGLYVYTRDGERTSVKIPTGCLLVQAGKQLEHITAGTILAGFHEVVVTEQTAAVLSDAKRDGKSQWRIFNVARINYIVVFQGIDGIALSVLDRPDSSLTATLTNG